MANRHDPNQIAAEKIAEYIGDFPFGYGPDRTLRITEGMITAVVRAGLDKGVLSCNLEHEPRAAHPAILGTGAVLSGDANREMYERQQEALASAQEVMGAGRPASDIINMYLNRMRQNDR